MSNKQPYDALEELYKAKKWADYIQLAEKIQSNLSHLNEGQLINFLFWLGQCYKILHKYDKAQAIF